MYYILAIIQGGIYYSSNYGETLGFMAIWD